MKNTLLSIAILSSLTLTGCSLDGDDGTDGAPGAQGPVGQQGIQGAAGNDASLGIELALTARSVLSDNGAAEIIQYHAASQTIFATNGADDAISMIDISGITSQALTLPSNDNSLVATSLSLPTELNGIALGSLTSIAIHDDLLAVAIPADAHADDGVIAFYNNLSTAPTLVKAVTVGNLPDMVTFTPDGSKVLVANEGEPSDDYSVDPEGSIAVIAVTNGVPADTATIIDFNDFNADAAVLASAGVLFPNPSGRTINGVTINTTVAQDLEPEYITANNQTAYVSMQENNALAVVNLADNSVEIVPLGLKSWAGLDIDTEENGEVSFAQFDGLFGAYQPDSIAQYQWQGQTIIVTANEGDAREYFFPVADEASCTAAGGQDYDLDDGCLAYTDEFKIKNLDAAPGSAFEALSNDDRIRNLRVTSAGGDTNNDGEFEFAVAYGARSFTLWDQNGLVIYDSGDDFERITATIYGSQFNNTDDENASDDRSENKGPEPEALTVATIGNRVYAFIGLERTGGVMIYDVTNPFSVNFVDYVNNRDFTEGLANSDGIGDLAPESLIVISATDSPTGKPILAVGNEVSGSVSLWEITQR